MKHWRDRVKECIPASQEQSTLALNDSLPDFLKNLDELISSETEKEAELTRAKEDLIGKVHGQHRANNSYSIDQMIDEYFILKDVVISVLKEEISIDLDTYKTIDDSFQKALQVSAAQFSKSILESQENFILTLTHDLRNPLMVIRMQSEILQTGKGNPVKSTERIKNSVDRIDKMVNHLLDKIKARSRITVVSDFTQFNLLEVAKRVASQFEDLVDGGIVVEGNSEIVCWSEPSFERVIDNLLTNAVKFGDNTLPITIRTGVMNRMFFSQSTISDLLFRKKIFSRSLNGLKKAGHPSRQKAGASDSLS